MDQRVVLSVWLVLALLALLWSQLALARTRHSLKRLRQDLGVPDGNLVPAAPAEMAEAVGSP